MKEKIGKFFNKIKEFFQNVFSKFMSWYRTSWLQKGLSIFWHYFSYIFWPFKWLKSKTYDKLRYEHQKVVVSIVFVAPVVIGFLLFFLYPLVMSLYYSFSTVQIDKETGEMIIHFGKGFLLDHKNAGDFTQPINDLLYNYKYIFFESSDYYLKELATTIGDTFIDTVVITIFSLLVAVLLNTNFKGRGAVRAIFFLPVIFNSEAVTAATETASSAVSQMAAAGKGVFAGIFDIKVFLQGLHVPPMLVTFLGNITSTIYDVISFSGVQILIFLAAIQSVSKQLYEAATMEGATKYEQFWKITLPMVSPMMIPVVVYTVVDSFLRSDINKIIDKYGSSGTSDYGIYSAMSWSYTISAIALLGVMMLFLRKVVFYYDKKN